MNNKTECFSKESKLRTARTLQKDVSQMVKRKEAKLMNAMWLEVTGCSGNIISLLNSENPGLYDILTNIVNMTFNNTLMANEGNIAFENFLETLDTEFILLVDGAVSTKENGFYNIVANYNGKFITALEAMELAAEKAKYVVAVGTCACYGGISAAAPNPSGSKSVQDIVSKKVIRLPGCPCHPDVVVGTVAHLVGYGIPELDSDGRPIIFYEFTIHDNCTRRGLFERGIFAEKFGEEGCMIKIGCKGPITKNVCPRRKWNGYVNWPIGDNTNCIGCANSGFPDGDEPFVKY